MKKGRKEGRKEDTTVLYQIVRYDKRRQTKDINTA